MISRASYSQTQRREEVWKGQCVMLQGMTPAIKCQEPGFKCFTSLWYLASRGNAGLFGIKQLQMVNNNLQLLVDFRQWVHLE